MNFPASDDRLLHRFLDGVMGADEAAACRARLQAEPRLRQQLQALQQLRVAFTEARQPATVAPAGFTTGVLAAARRLPSRDDADLDGAWGEGGQQGLLRLCRRLLLAAAVLFGLGLLTQAGLFGDGRADTLQAAPGDVQREMDRLDAVPLPGAAGEAGPGIRAERRGQ